MLGSPIDWQQIRREAANPAIKREIDALSAFMQQMPQAKKMEAL